MKRVLMVGAGSCQINGIKKLKAMGYHTVVADYSESSGGKLLADDAVLADAFDAKAIERCAALKRVDAILTVGTDQPVLTVALAAEKNGLFTFIPSGVALHVTNKKWMKRIFLDRNIPTAKFAVLSKRDSVDEVIRFEGPYVVKPVDSQGQRGIFKLNDKNAVKASIDEVLKYSRSDEILVEQFYANDEVTVSGWVHNGFVKVLTLTDRVTFSPDQNIGVCTSHEYPSKYSFQYGKRINEWTETICDVFQIKEGPIYFQFLIGAEGILVNEIACRLGGAYEDVTIPYATGANVLELNILGVADHENYLKIVDNIFSVDSEMVKPFSTQLFFCEPGKIMKMTSIEDIKMLPYILDAGYNFGVGDEIPRTENASARAGYAVVVGEDEYSVQRNLSKFYDTIEVIGENGKNLIIKQKRNRIESF
ncbi:MAG: ATP-grasp domain-containing protein [Bacillota bacterium]|nr:ATP-grasp domain-containing protein [Bacillota bacterium]